MASFHIVRPSVLSGIADALRSAYGTSDPFPVSTFASAITGVKDLQVDYVTQYIDGTLREYVNDEISEIGNYAFYGLSSLKRVSCANVTSISTSAFYYCSSLSDVSFPNVTSINAYAFYSCYSLAVASFPNVLATAPYAFYNCISLMTASLPAVKNINDSTFYGCRSLRDVQVENVLYIGSYTFYSCASLTCISLPNVLSLGSNAFRDCVSLESIYILTDHVPSMGNNAVFYNVPGSIYVKSSMYSAFITSSFWSVISTKIVSYV